jgi:hypothetical protein
MPGSETTAPTVTRTLLEAPLPELIARLGLAIAEAQAALDTNSISVAQAMATTDEKLKIKLGEESYSLLELGFVPTFYAFTEATIEAKLSFSVQESRETTTGGSATVGYGVLAASVNASYTRKFGFQAEGASSIAARLISLPPPTEFMQRLNALRASDDQG